MKDEIKEIYLSGLEWTKTHDNIGGVMGNLVFKHNMSYEEYQKILKNTYFVLCNKDYITNLQQENGRLKKALCKDNIVSKCKYDYLKRQKEELELNLFCIKDYKSRNEKAIEYIKGWQSFPHTNCTTHNELKNLLEILQGVGKDE